MHQFVTAFVQKNTLDTQNCIVVLVLRDVEGGGVAGDHIFKINETKNSIKKEKKMFDICYVRKFRLFI